MRLQFHLSPQQVQKICTSRTAQGTYGIQVLLRFARKESSCEQEDFYPMQCYVKVNSTYCTIPGYNPHFSVRPDYKRLGSPVNITSLIKTSPSLTNDLTYYWVKDVCYPQGFCTEVTLAESLSASDLLQELKLRGVRSPDVSRALVRDKLTIDRDSEISATSLRVSLLCPLGKLRMTHPCRSQMCTHLQCFDASIFLQMNEKKARWVCPVCDRPATADSLVIDGLFKEICAESNCTDIEFISDGSWHPISAKDVPTHRLTPERKLVARESFSPVTITDSASPTPADSNRYTSEGTVFNPIVIDEEDEAEEDEDEEEVISTSSSRMSISIAHIVGQGSSHSTTAHQRDSHPRGDSARDRAAYRDGMTRSVIVKRRFSSTTEGGGSETSSHHEYSVPLTSTTSTTSTTTTTADQRHTPSIPVPVITEYAPTLPYLSGAPLLPFLAAQQSVRTILASSDNPLATAVSSGGEHINIDELPSLNCESLVLLLLLLLFVVVGTNREVSMCNVHR